LFWLCVIARAGVTRMPERTLRPTDHPTPHLSLSIDERRSRNPMRRQTDTRRAVLARPIQFSKNRPESSRILSHPGARPPPGWGPETGMAVFRGTFLHYSSDLRLSTFFDTTSGNSSRLLPDPWRCGVRLGSPGTRELGDAESENSMLRAEGGVSTLTRPPLLEGHFTALSGAAEPRRATPCTDCLTYGRPVTTRSQQV
jgi:hypothetical protein